MSVCRVKGSHITELFVLAVFSLCRLPNSLVVTQILCPCKLCGVIVHTYQSLTSFTVEGVVRSS